MIEGNDGGATVTFNGGETWSSIYNQPTAQFYHVTTDNQIALPRLRRAAGQPTISVPSRSAPLRASTRADWEEIGGGESGYIAVRPDDPNIVYAGNYFGLPDPLRSRAPASSATSPSGRRTLIGSRRAATLKYRFQWTFPILLSPHDPHVLYATGNHVFRSTDEGASWEVISPT